MLPRTREVSGQRCLLKGNVPAHPLRKQIVSGGADGLVEVWNFKPQIRPFKFAGHKGQVNDVLFNADSTKVISCGDDREIRIWKNSV
jgi:centriolar protein POC1